MSEVVSAAAPAAGPEKKKSLDRWLTVAITVLIVAIVGFAGYFAYTVWTNYQRDQLTNAPIRLIKGIEAQVRKQPNDVILRVRLGEAYGAAGKYDKAVAQFKEALKIDPKHIGAYLDLGMVATLSGNDTASERYCACARTHPTPISTWRERSEAWGTPTARSKTSSSRSLSTRVSPRLTTRWASCTARRRTM